MSLTKNPGRFAGLLYIVASILAIFALLYVPSKLIVHGNPTATADNIASSETLFRLGIGPTSSARPYSSLSLWPCTTCLKGSTSGTPCSC